jgi:hypothetical protein
MVLSTERITMITHISGSTAAPLSGGEAGAKAAQKPASPQGSLPSVTESAALSSQVALAGRVVAQPSIRAEEVERAKALVASPNYPPRAIVEAVAKLVAESNHALE